MPIRLDELKKVETSSLRGTNERNDEELLELIVKVREANYVPSAVTMRARIDPHLFTGQAVAKSLADLERDPQVISVSVSKKLHPGR